jgi:hypothetical protein
MSKHTPGPWQIASNGKAGSTYRIWRNDPDNTEETNRGYACIAPHVHGEANAHLVAAAPDLLQALIDVKLALDGFQPVNDAIHAQVMNALAKATGQ